MFTLSDSSSTTQKNNTPKKRILWTQVLRNAIQIAALLLFPGLFVSVFGALRDLVTNLIAGTFTFSAMAPQLLTLLTVFGVTALWGRFFCGCFCAFGTIQELLAILSEKLLPKKGRVPQKWDRVLKFVKYGVLGSVVLFVWVLQLPIDSSLSPWGVFGMLISGNLTVMGEAVLTVGFLGLELILITSFFIERFFCRYFCPLGAIFAPLSKLRLYKIRRATTKCTGCKKCTRVCAMGIDVSQNDTVTSGECIDCMRCIPSCAPEALRANPHPAVAGTAAALVMGSVISVGRILPSEPISTNAALESIETVPEQTKTDVLISDSAASGYANGVFTGTGTGFRDKISAQVTVENGIITDITILSHRDDDEFFRKAQSGVIGAILSAQKPQVDAVSGATYSSYGIMEAVADALKLTEIKEEITLITESKPEPSETGKPIDTDENTSENKQGGPDNAQQNENSSGGGSRKRQPNGNQSENSSGRGRQEKSSSGQPGSGKPKSGSDSKEDEGLVVIEEAPREEPESDSEQKSTSTPFDAVANGVYTGTGTGYRGQTQVRVTVENGQVTDITVLSYADDGKYFTRAQSGVIEAILEAQSLDVKTVSGATFSSNGILEAVADALQIEFSNPNDSSSRGHGR